MSCHSGTGAKSTSIQHTGRSGEERKGSCQTANLHPEQRAQPRTSGSRWNGEPGGAVWGRTLLAVCPLLRNEGGAAQPWPNLPALFMILCLSSSFTSGACGVWHEWCLKTSDLVPSLNLSSWSLSSRDGTHSGGWTSSGVLCSRLFRPHYPFRRKKIKLLDPCRKADKGLPARNADSCVL